MLRLFAFSVVLLLFFTTSLPAVGGYKVADVVNGGAVKGRIIFKGEAPPEVKMRISEDQQVCGYGFRRLKGLELSPEDGVANAVVIIEGVTEGKPFPRAVQLIDQHDCSFIPHVQVAEAGHEFVILNSDPVHHNIHGYLRGRTVFNLAQPFLGKRIPVVLSGPGIIEIRCDIHPWMKAWVHVVEHPYYSITNSRGEFNIDDIPPGTYRLKVWQEMLGVMEQEVTIKPGTTFLKDFTYESTAR